MTAIQKAPLPVASRVEFNWLGAFIDANERRVQATDIVEYRFGARRGILQTVLHDGDAVVFFRDTRCSEVVKWTHLCKVPEAGDA